MGEVWVGYDQANAGKRTLTNTSISISSWLAIDRGNGVIGSQSVVSLYDSARSSVNTYTGLTIVSNGTLLVNGIVANPVTVAAGTVGVRGKIMGAVTVNPLGILAPGNAAIGTLTNNTMTLLGTTVAQISRNSGVLTSDKVVGLTTLNYGGALIVTNAGPDALQIGDTF